MISIELVTDALLRHGLLDDEALGEVCHELEKRGEAVDGSNLLAALSAEGKLTPYQVDAVRNGRTSELMLGNYLVLSKLGEGGMGTVYKALHRRMQRVVALKVIKKAVATKDFISRFRREIQLTARLNHPNVVIAYDSDQCPLGDFLVMEYVEGTDLGEVLKRTGPLSVDDAISAVRQAALGLGYAHQLGIVHRDIKPANLLRDIHGVVKVVDLGLASVTRSDSSSSELTQIGTVAGTVDYMSPEQADNPLGVDGRSDIYSLGCTLFYLLTSSPVFATSSLVSRLMAHRSEPPPKLNSVRDEVPVALDAIFQRMVAKSPKNRYGTMEEVVAALDALNSGRGVSDESTQFISASELSWSPTESSILIVEESRLQAGIIARTLKQIGVADVLTCSTGAEALEKLATMPLAVVLCSLRLPDMSGLELAARIRDSLRWVESAIVLMSSDEWTPQRQSAAEQHGRLRMIRKPFDGEGLRRTIEDALADKRDRQPIGGLSELKVLIVDDSGLARRNEQDTLSSLGFTTFTQADDGDTAIELMQQQKFDLLITDYHMPRVDGRELIAYVRQHGHQRDLPIVMVTTEFDPKLLAPIYDLGVSAITSKSFDRELVRNIVIQLFA